MKEDDFEYLDVVQGRQINTWFGVSKFCSTVALRKALQWKKTWDSASYDMGIILARS